MSCIDTQRTRARLIFTDKQNQLNCHQDDNDILAVHKNANHADGEQRRARERKVMIAGQVPWPRSPSLISGFNQIDIASLAAARKSAWQYFWRLMCGLDDASVSTIAPIMATSSTNPASLEQQTRYSVYITCPIASALLSSAKPGRSIEGMHSAHIQSPQKDTISAISAKKIIPTSSAKWPDSSEKPLFQSQQNPRPASSRRT